MTQEAAQAILAEIQQDERITATLDIDCARPHRNRGYRVRLTLRNWRTITIRQPYQWHEVRRVWEGL